MPRLRGQQRREKQKLKQRRGDEEWEENDAKSEKEQKKGTGETGKVRNRMKQMKTTVALNIGKMYKLH